MKKSKCKIGEVVQIPYHCFAPQRSGWNGWLFTNAQIIRSAGKNSKGQKLYCVDYFDPNTKYLNHYEKIVCENCIFEDPYVIENSQRLLNEHPDCKENLFLWLLEKGLINENT